MKQEHIQQAGKILIAYWQGRPPDDTLMFRACGQLARMVLATMKPRKQISVKRNPERYRLEIMNLLQQLAADEPGATELIATLAGISTPTQQRDIPRIPAITIQGDYSQINVGNIVDTIVYTTPAQDRDDVVKSDEDSKNSENKLSKLRDMLDRHFDDDELHNICFDIHIDYENLSAQTKSGRARELVAYVERRGRTAELIALCHRLRPHVDW